MAAIALSPAYAASEIDVPYIGEPADRALSPLQETQLGREVMRQLLASNYVLEDAEVTDYLRSLGKRLLQQTNEQAIEFHFFVVRDTAINAFALPGGFIGINAGLLTASQSESELAGVLAHEIAHVTQRHIARSMDDSKGWDIASTALLLAAIIAGAHDADIAQAALSLGMSAMVQHQINFTRANELEADRLGIKTLSAAGLDPNGMAAFFHRLSQKAQLYGEGMPEILRTHPVSTTRIAEAQARAQNLPRVSHTSSLDYKLMKARTAVLMTELASDSLRLYKTLSERKPSVAHDYGYALALNRNRAYGPAEKQLKALLKQHPEQLNMSLALGRTLHEAKQADAAVKHLQNTLKRHPDSRSAMLALANILLQQGQPQEARQLLLESNLLLADEPEAYRLLALAARDMQEPAEAHFQMSGYAHSRGDFVAAIHQLRNGLSLEELNEHDRKRLEGRLNQYYDEAPESERKRSREEERQRGQKHYAYR